MVKYDARYVWFVLYLILILFTVFPVSLPMEISPPSQAAYDFVESLPDGSLVMCVVEYGGPGVMWHPFAMALLHQLEIKDVRVVFLCDHLPYVTWIDEVIDDSGYRANREYGVDYVNLGFLAGDEAGAAALATDPHGVYVEDYYGNDIDTLEIMDDFNHATDIDLVVTIEDVGLCMAGFMRQWQEPYGVPLFPHVKTGGYRSILTFWTAGNIVGGTDGEIGGAMYENLVGRPGKASAVMTTSSVCHFLFVAMIILGNINYFYKRGKGEVK